jgi:UDP-N-acetylglucosamine:LPS N-acetylglucosamine transferase
MPYRTALDDTGQIPPPSGPGPRGITIISARVGAGHDGAAEELSRRLETAGFSVDRYDFLDLLPLGLGRILSAAYHRLLTLAPTGYQRIYAGLERADRPGPLLRALFRCAQRHTLRALSPSTQAVVSTYPGASQVLGSLRRHGRLAVPALTYLTDFSVHPLWIAPGIDAHLAVHPIPAGQARSQGAMRVVVAGPVTRPRFTPVTEDEGRAARLRFGLPEGPPLALLVAGSWGVGAVRESANEIKDTGAAVPVVVCGRNEALAEQLRLEGMAYVRGWEPDMPGLMHACDVLVQNAGGLTSLEAFAVGLPVISYRCIPGHGQTNAAALDQAGLALWVRTPGGLGPALTALAGGPLGDRQRAAGLALHHQGQGPAAFIAAAASKITVRTLPVIPAVRRRTAPRRIRVMAAAIVATVSLGIGAPLTHAYQASPSRFTSAAHHFLERYEL